MFGRLSLPSAVSRGARRCFYKSSRSAWCRPKIRAPSSHQQQEEDVEDEDVEEFDEHEFGAAVADVKVEQTESYVDDSLPGERRDERFVDADERDALRHRQRYLSRDYRYMIRSSVRLQNGALVVPHSKLGRKASERPQNVDLTPAAKRPSHRHDRVKRAVGRCLESALDDVGGGAIFRTSFEMIGVDVTNDLRMTKIFFCVDKKREWPAVNALLQRYNGTLRDIVGKKVPLKYVPVLSFRYVENPQHVELLRQQFEGAHE